MKYPCGCWSGGAWFGVQPPPQCDGTNCDLDRRNQRNQRLAAANMWTQSSTTIRIPVAEPTTDDALAVLIKHAHAESGRAEADGEHAAFDAWQAVVHALREVAVRVAAAKAARP